MNSLQNLKQTIDDVVAKAQVTDIHTHLFAPSFGTLLLWGIDEMLTYHYLVSEAMRWLDMPYETFWALPKKEQADLVWKTLFVENSPVSESCRGVLTVLEKLELDVKSRSLEPSRRYFRGEKIGRFVERVFKLAGVRGLVMTNDPFDVAERAFWDRNGKIDERFHTALRLDVLLNNWKDAYTRLRSMGFRVSGELTGPTLKEVRKFLLRWTERTSALYMAASLPPDFTFPEKSVRGVVLQECILPVAAERNLPFAAMIGVKKLTHPALKLAGDSVGRARVEVVEKLCREYPQNKFMVTMLSSENQHELCVAARKFRNLMPFGCWWFLNNPGLIEKITRERLELLGLSFIPQHSDARVLDQLIYKWEHSRRIIADVLFEKYRDTAQTGWCFNRQDIERDVDKLFGGNFWSFLK